MMKHNFPEVFILALVLSTALIGCSTIQPAAMDNLEPASLETGTLSPSSQSEIQAVRKVAVDYLEAWKNDHFRQMYAQLTSLSKDALPEEEFNRHYNSIANEAALKGIDYEILSVLVNPDTAQIKYRISLHSVLVGDIERDTLMNLRLEGKDWRIEWDDTLVLPELKGGNYLVMNRSGYVPARANIYDRKGLALVAQSDATAVGLLPDEVDPARTAQLFSTLSEVTGVSEERIQSLYTSAPPGSGWYIPLGEVSAEVISNQYSLLSSLPGIRMQPYKSRYYFEGGVASHVLGYVSSIQPDQVDEYLRLGYQQDDRVGQSGIEKWGEAYLAGKRGGALYVFNAQGQPVTRLAEASAEASQSVYLTLDRDFQVAAQQAISNFRGAIVILERDTGKVLAMVSSPGFDPNAFEPVNLNSQQLQTDIGNNPGQPLLNRATQGQYPLGSVFKIITMAAGLEIGVYTPASTYQCGYFFDELPGARLNDWTYDYFLQDGRVLPSGLLTLPEGLMRSCNPFFWHIGLDLFNQGYTTAISDMARKFGLSKPTGIVGLDEANGLIPDPKNQVDAVNMAIGQGDVLVTPVQVANFVAAIGNGGKIYRPQLVEKITQQDGKTVVAFKPEVAANLPLTTENLSVIQQAMVGVIRNEKPRGTAWYVFTGLDVPTAGKTGTAQSPNGAPHAWFAGYTFAEQPGKPDIAGVVLIENVGEGTDYAAPVFRRIVELYFNGQPQTLYRWESSFNVPSSSETEVGGTSVPPASTPPGQ